MNSILVGVTGGIGSGKSAVCRVFEQCGAEVYYADPSAKRLMRNPEVLEKMEKLFGPQVLLPDGRLNTEYVAGQVFADSVRLKALNGLIHPLVFADFERWVRLHEAEKVLFLESALIVEAGWADRFDKLVVVTAPEEIRIGRVMERDRVGREQVEARMKHQMRETDRLKYADYTVCCDERHLMIPQAVRIYEMLSNFKYSQ